MLYVDAKMLEGGLRNFGDRDDASSSLLRSRLCRWLASAFFFPYTFNAGCLFTKRKNAVPASRGAWGRRCAAKHFWQLRLVGASVPP